MNAFNGYVAYFTLSCRPQLHKFFRTFSWVRTLTSFMEFKMLCFVHPALSYSALWSVFLETNYINSIHELTIIKIEQPLINSYGRKRHYH
jgi:hypothetical protein